MAQHEELSVTTHQRDSLFLPKKPGGFGALVGGMAWLREGLSIPWARECFSHLETPADLAEPVEGRNMGCTIVWAIQQGPVRVPGQQVYQTFQISTTKILKTELSLESQHANIGQNLYAQPTQGGCMLKQKIQIGPGSPDIIAQIPEYNWKITFHTKKQEKSQLEWEETRKQTLKLRWIRCWNYLTRILKQVSWRCTSKHLRISLKQLKKKNKTRKS